MHNYSCGASFTSLFYHANEVLRTARQEPLLPSGSEQRLVPQRGPPAPRFPSAGSAWAAGPSLLPAGADRRAPGPAETCVAPAVSRRHPRSPVLRAEPGAACGARLAPRAAAPSSAAGSSADRGQDGGRRCPARCARPRGFRRAPGCSSVEGLRGDEASPRAAPGSRGLAGGACGRAAGSALPGARHNPQKVAARRKSRILPEPRPPGWRAVAKGHQKEGGSGGAAHLCRFPAASAAQRRPGSRRRSPPGSRPAQPRAALQPRRS